MARHRKLTQKFAGFPIFKVGTSGDTFPITSPFTSEFVGLDGLSLDLQFAADKTLTARKGPTPVFTRGSTGTFVGSDGLIQSAAINAARFDHDPLTLACKGLLIEEARTNSITGSNAFNTWTTTGASVAASSVSTPEGTADAWKVVEDSLLSIHTATRAFTAVSGTTYTASLWLKAAENGFAFLGLVGNAFPTFTLISVDLSTGAVTTATGTPVGAVSVAYSNGWWRVSISQTATFSTSANIDIRLSRDGVFANRSYLGNGVNGMYVYGAQVEAGAFPTSYIPTVASSVVRSADVCSITGSAFTGFYNASEGTIIAAASVDVLAGNNRGIYGINNNTASHGFLTFYNASSSGIISQSRNTASTTLSPTFTNSAGVKFTRALAYYLGGCSIATNGSAVTDTAATISTQTMLTLQIGNMLAGSFQGTCHIPSIRYFKKRLPNAKLQTLTT
jgi:hypothetical protein